jgi:ABC-type lipoprotein export system ATPase subunit
MTNIYELENIECRYSKSNRTVLKIESLTIKQGEVVFFIGASGVGKSTILETLGLMNKTVVPNANSKFDFITSEGNRTNLIQLWQKGDKALSRFRRKHLSFIFQQTNLFPYLTVHQNANIVQVIQGKDYVDANQATKLVFKKLTLDFGKEQSPKVTNISGGQRQRVAFARAISTSYDVLFADEPTGNLDWYNADNLMGILQRSIKENNKTAIIVSHDITLALNYATSIVLIEKMLDTTNDNTFGLIGNKQIFKKNGDGWNNEVSNLTRESLEQMLKSKIQQQSEFNNQNKI